ncbi:hypothetical protein XENOCAPTIV_026562 [Xenoophorus captivus]|uniref:Uncharacterized protein n=1 Tax=Xenoophorus captivus TaxID=1517983 RepID=A0ABV0QBN7_9TELE
MMAANDVEMSRRVLSITNCCHQVEHLVLVLQWAGESSQYRTDLHYVNATVTSRYYLNDLINPLTVPLHEQHRLTFTIMNNNTPAHQGHIDREWLLETGVLGMK